MQIIRKKTPLILIFLFIMLCISNIAFSYPNVFYSSSTNSITFVPQINESASFLIDFDQDHSSGYFLSHDYYPGENYTNQTTSFGSFTGSSNTYLNTTSGFYDTSTYCNILNFSDNITLSIGPWSNEGQPINYIVENNIGTSFSLSNGIASSQGIWINIPGVTNAWGGDGWLSFKTDESNFENTAIILENSRELWDTVLQFGIAAASFTRFGACFQMPNPVLDTWAYKLSGYKDGVYMLETASPAHVGGSYFIEESMNALSFDYFLSNIGEEDIFSMSINGDILFSSLGKYLVNEKDLYSGLIDISKYSGKKVDILFSIFSETSGETAKISNISFYNAETDVKPIPEPSNFILIIFGILLYAILNRKYVINTQNI